MRETEKGFRLRDNEDYYSREEIENYNDQLTDDLMMPGTSINNKLANEEFVNSSITHMAANPRGNWPNWNSVPTDPTLYPADADGNKTPSNNDYMVVQDMTGYVNPEEPSRTYEGTWRFTYVGEWDDPIPGGTKGKTGWKPIYQVNEKPLTQAQVDALNSGVNSTKVSNYDSHVGNTNNPHRVTKEQIGLQNVDNTSDRNKPVSDPQQTELDKKVDIAQGSQNEGKILGIDNEGNVVPVDPPQSGVTPEQLATKLDKTNEISKIEVVTELPQIRDLYTMYMVVEEEEDWPGLKLEAYEYTEISYNIIGDAGPNLFYSYDGKAWNSWDGYVISVNQGESIYIWNRQKTLSTSLSDYVNISISGNVRATGNIASLIDFGELTPYCFRGLFANCAGLFSIPELPFLNLAPHCYHGMFANCTSLTQVGFLPATELADSCYKGMFYGCSNLSSVEYDILPAIELADNCYEMMFSNSGITEINLPAQTLAVNCYSSIFKGCTHLSTIRISYDGNFLTDYFTEWVNNVASTGTLYYNGSDTSRGDSAIPQNWAVQAN